MGRTMIGPNNPARTMTPAMTNATTDAIRGDSLRVCMVERLYASGQWNRAEELSMLREKLNEILGAAGGVEDRSKGEGYGQWFRSDRCPAS